MDKLLKWYSLTPLESPFLQLHHHPSYIQPLISHLIGPISSSNAHISLPVADLAQSPPTTSSFSFATTKPKSPACAPILVGKMSAKLPKTRTPPVAPFLTLPI